MTYILMHQKKNPFHLNPFSLSICIIIIITMISGILFLIRPGISSADFEYDFGWVPPDPNVENALIDEGKADIKITPGLPSYYLKPKHDMEEYSPVLQQSGPSCVAFAVTSLMEYLYGKRYASTSKRTIRFSPIDLFCTCKAIEMDENLFSLGDPNEGTFNYLAIQYALRDYGIYPERCYQSCYPGCGTIDPKDLCAVDNYNVCDAKCGSSITSRGYSFIDSKPSPYKLDVMKSCLYNNRVFIASIPVFRNWNDMLENKDSTGDVPDPVNPYDPNYTVSGHALCFVGYKDVEDDPNWPGGGYFWFKNSWSTNWGYEGYGRISYDYMLMYSREIVVLDESEIMWSRHILVDDCIGCVENNPPEIKGLIFDGSTLSLIVGKELTFSVVAADKDQNDDLTYSLRNPIPKGVKLDTSSGVIQWTPKSEGEHYFNITVRDRCDSFDNKNIKIEVPDCDSCCKKCPACNSCCNYRDSFGNNNFGFYGRGFDFYGMYGNSYGLYGMSGRGYGIYDIPGTGIGLYDNILGGGRYTGGGTYMGGIIGGNTTAGFPWP